MYYQGLIRVDVHRKPAGHCKAIILQLKVNKFLKAPLQKKKNIDLHSLNGCIVWHMNYMSRELFRNTMQKYKKLGIELRRMWFI